jgi:hypothetical protein
VHIFGIPIDLTSNPISPAARTAASSARNKMSHFVRVKLARGAQSNMHLSALAPNNNERKHPGIITEATDEQVVNGPGAEEGFRRAGVQVSTS